MALAASVLVVVSFLFSAATCVSVLLSVLRVPRLQQLTPPIPNHSSKVSVLLPARDEATTVGASIDRLLADKDPDLEIVAVDDRSSDATGAVLDAQAGRDSRLRALHVRDLPEGWLGKVYALEQASRAATGEWLVVMDADVRVAPGVVRKVLAWCEAEGVDYVTVLPRLDRATYLVDLVIPVAMRAIVATEAPWLARRTDTRRVTGFGAFNLVRREVLNRTEGFGWYRLDVADDIALALLVKRAGGECAVLNASKDVSLLFYANFPELMRRLEKNVFAVLGRFSAARTWVVVSTWILCELGFLGALYPGVPRPVQAVGAAAYLFGLVSTSATATWFGMPLWLGLFFPFGVALLAFVQARAGWVGFRQGGIRWRDTFYPSAVLKKGVRASFLP